MSYVNGFEWYSHDSHAHRLWVFLSARSGADQTHARVPNVVGSAMDVVGKRGDHDRRTDLALITDILGSGVGCVSEMHCRS